MKGEWVKEKYADGDLSYLVPEGYHISRYFTDVPNNDEKQFDCIVNYMVDKYKINENEALIHWAYYSQKGKPGIKGIIGQSFTLKKELNGNFAIIRIHDDYDISKINEDRSNVFRDKFIYLFFTALSVPLDFPLSKYNEIENSLINLVNRNELNLDTNRMSIFAPVIYLIEDQVDCEFFKHFEMKINEIRKQILFHNPIKNLHMTKFSGIHNK